LASFFLGCGFDGMRGAAGRFWGEQTTPAPMLAKFQSTKLFTLVNQKMYLSRTHMRINMLVNKECIKASSFNALMIK
jgi:hypothetical protein